MPVLIVEDTGGSTNTQNGTIKLADLHTISDDFKSHVALTALPPRNAITKRNCFYFTKKQIRALFDQYKSNPEANAIEIAIGVHIPNTIVNCNQGKVTIDNSNCLGVIISMTNKDTSDPLNEVGDYVLINGYQPKEKFRPIDECCPGSKPPPPSN